MATLIAKYAKAVQQFGFRGTLLKLYTNGDVKFGKLMGKDKFGNEYYENRYDYPYGQHRWVENMVEIHDYCPSMVPPEWHSWLHSMTDNLPTDDKAWEYGYIKANAGANNIYTDNHTGGVVNEHQPNKTAYKDRAYGFGSQYSKGAGVEEQYLQPGHVLNRYGKNPDGSSRAGDYDPHRSTLEDGVRVATRFWENDDDGQGEKDDDGQERLRSLQKD
eukprot:g4983.t1